MLQYWQKALLSTLFCLVFGFGSVVAKSFVSASAECDTLITNEGKTILIVVVQSTLDSVIYRDCGDANGAIKQISRNDFRSIRFNEQTERLGSEQPEGALRLDEELYKYPRLATIGLALCLTGIFLVVLTQFVYFLLTGLLVLLGLGLLLAGTICSLVFLRGTRWSKKMYKKQRNQAKAGAIIGLILSGILLFLVVVALFLFGV